jgi:hypothetical protein
LVRAFNRFAVELKNPGVDGFSLEKSTVVGLCKDLTEALEMKIPAYLPDAFFAGKAALLGGSPDVIEPGTWNQALKTLGTVAGPAFALIDLDRDTVKGPNEYGQFLVSVIEDVELELEVSIERKGGSIPAADIDRLIDSLPADMSKAGKPALKQVARLVTKDLLGAEEAGSIDKKALLRALLELNRWKRAQTAIESIFVDAKLDPLGATKGDVLTELARYARLPADESKRVASIVTDYWPMFMGADDGQVSLSRETLYTKNHLTQLNWISYAADFVIKSISSEHELS